MFTPDASAPPTIPPATNPPSVYFIYADQLDASRVVIDQNNQIRWRWMAEPFGTSAPETNPSSLGAFTQNLRFPGQYADQETGLSYNWHRDYELNMKVIATVYSVLLALIAFWAWGSYLFYESSIQENLLPSIILNIVTLPSSILIENLVGFMPWLLNSPIALLSIATGLGVIQMAFMWLIALRCKFPNWGQQLQDNNKFI